MGPAEFIANAGDSLRELEENDGPLPGTARSMER